MTCLETFATLRVFSGSLSPEEIGRTLEVEPTRITPRDIESKYKNRKEQNLWAWSSEGKAESHDGLIHIRQITSLLEGKQEQLGRLRTLGCEVDICCYWVSSGQGGPLLDVAALQALADLKLEIWWEAMSH